MPAGGTDWVTRMPRNIITGLKTRVKDRLDCCEPWGCPSFFNVEELLLTLRQAHICHLRVVLTAIPITCTYQTHVCAGLGMRQPRRGLRWRWRWTRCAACRPPSITATTSFLPLTDAVAAKGLFSLPPSPMSRNRYCPVNDASAFVAYH